MNDKWVRYKGDDKVLKRFHINLTTGCWDWTGAKAAKGYGMVGSVAGHRRSYEIFRGQIPEGMQIDHLCRNRACINPFHLEVVTQQENNLRGNSVTAQHSRKTHCSKGHPLFGDNMRISREGFRVCRKCHSDRNVASYKRMRDLNG